MPKSGRTGSLEFRCRKGASGHPNSPFRPPTSGPGPWPLAPGPLQRTHRPSSPFSGRRLLILHRRHLLHQRRPKPHPGRHLERSSLQATPYPKPFPLSASLLMCLSERLPQFLRSQAFSRPISLKQNGSLPAPPDLRSTLELFMSSLGAVIASRAKGARSGGTETPGTRRSGQNALGHGFRSQRVLHNLILLGAAGIPNEPSPISGQLELGCGPSPSTPAAKIRKHTSYDHSPRAPAGAP